MTKGHFYPFQVPIQGPRGPKTLLPSGSPFGDPGPHGDLFQFLGPQKVPIFFQGPHFLYFRLKNALKIGASTIGEISPDDDRRALPAATPLWPFQDQSGDTICEHKS